ncbi:MAG: YraN family protein [Gammaproteobacteria bacterium]|nr:YraN family protein [Gammaproteobacteria bacterium]
MPSDRLRGVLQRFARRRPAPRPPTTKQRDGATAEALAAAHLEHAGLALLARNYRTPFGEIDLVMEQGQVLVFVEVRFRGRVDYGMPAETVGNRKQARLRATAEHFLQHDRRASNRPCRFDIVAITPAPSGAHQLEWLQDAF